MRIQVVTDLHQEFGFMDISLRSADLILLANDINLGTKEIEWINYVLGNQEYYKGSYPKTLNAIRSSASDSNNHVLENKAVVIRDVTFYGAIRKSCVQ